MLPAPAALAARVLLLIAVVYGAACLLLWVLRDRMIFPVRGTRTAEPAVFGMPDGRAVTIPTPDGEQLAAWYFPPADTAGAALLWFHGNAEWISGFADLVRALRPARAGLLVVDYRGYGSSTGRPTVAGVTLDGLAAWDWLVARPEVDPSRVVVFGRSVGSGPALHVAAERAVAGVVVESAFTSLRAMARQHYPIFPSVLAGAGFDNLAAIRRVRAPVLFIIGAADRIVPPAMGRTLADAAAGPTEVWRIPGADHNSTYPTAPDEYRRRLHTFIDRHTSRD
jgi:hypothetical protein